MVKYFFFLEFYRVSLNLPFFFRSGQKVATSALIDTFFSPIPALPFSFLPGNASLRSHGKMSWVCCDLSIIRVDGFLSLSWMCGRLYVWDIHPQEFCSYLDFLCDIAAEHESDSTDSKILFEHHGNEYAMFLFHLRALKEDRETIERKFF